MGRIKESLSLFLIVNAAVLYIIYYIVSHFAAITLLLSKILSSLFSAMSPLFIGIIIAYVMSPLVNLIDSSFLAKVTPHFNNPLKNYKFMRKRYLISILFSFLIVTLAIISLIYAFAALVSGTINVGSLTESIEKLTDYFSTLKRTSYHLIENIDSEELRQSAESFYSYILDYLSGRISGRNIVTLIGNFGSSIIDIALGLIVSIYLLNDQRYFRKLCRKFLHLILPQKVNAIVTEIASEINEVLSQFLRGALLDAGIVGIISAVALSIYNLEFSLLLGCLAGILNVIPYFGPFFGMVPAFLVGLLTEDFTFALGAILILLVIQQIDTNIIYPKIVGQSTGLHPLFVLLAVSILGYYCGIAGMIVAVPAAGIINVLIKAFISS